MNLCELCERFEARNLASLEGFEPTTRCLEGSRSVQLSYRDKKWPDRFDLLFFRYESWVDILASCKKFLKTLVDINNPLLW